MSKSNLVQLVVLEAQRAVGDDVVVVDVDGLVERAGTNWNRDQNRTEQGFIAREGAKHS